MKSDINKLYQNCFSCRRELLRLVPLGGQRSHQLSKRFDTLVIDFCGPFSDITVDGIKSPHIIILIDSFTTWLELRLVEGPTARAAAKSVTEWSLRFGSPLYLLSDRGLAFTAELKKLVSQAFSIDSVPSGGYHPTPQGQAEKAVSLVKSSLRKLCAHGPMQLALQNLQWICRFHNTAPRSYGDEDITPEDL
ncbi:gag/pol/env polyprotein, putative [Perkinsus marinus ATCC 50983]|uniref:Gag/pol/env polyprotein, putative n=1 Tax=Perkinsus marinus (strain ATCC 50983 / TXsc) TaxID=423536 RepID=C5KVR5_PERM5|nr:gag/pol/env polyprotein, putative [Perkinsus marinus ATCC 50983]EER11450.1 gag/pol/env polyprotein, putative [Perkinsus marinus ATCC 50983]|eukprot:XP_002779655.1 gag/pol/env polyprotein, putative [Perkinsus marinus ATCC 50983]